MVTDGLALGRFRQCGPDGPFKKKIVDLGKKAARRECRSSSPITTVSISSKRETPSNLYYLYWLCSAGSRTTPILSASDLFLVESLAKGEPQV